MKKRISIFSLIMLVFLLGTYSQVQAENKVWTDPVTDPVFPTSFLVTYCPCESHFDIVFSNDIALSGAAIPIKWDSVGYLDSSCNIPSVVFSGSRIEDIENKSIKVDNENRRVLISFECDPGNFISPGSGKLCQLSLNGLEEAAAGNFYMDIDTCIFWDEGIPYVIHYRDTTGSPVFPEFVDTTWLCEGMVNMVPDIFCPSTVYALKGEEVSFQILADWPWELHYLIISDFSPTPVNPPDFWILEIEHYILGYFEWQTDQADLAGIYTATFETEDHYCRKVDEQTQIFVFDYGDANADFQVNLADVVWLVSYLFLNGPAPQVFLTGDANCDGQINLADAVYLVNYLFINGPEPSCY
jgi:hypothetical protein